MIYLWETAQVLTYRTVWSLDNVQSNENEEVRISTKFRGEMWPLKDGSELVYFIRANGMRVMLHYFQCGPSEANR
jgi:hypothetical protein